MKTGKLFKIGKKPSCAPAERIPVRRRRSIDQEGWQRRRADSQKEVMGFPGGELGPLLQ